MKSLRTLSLLLGFIMSTMLISQAFAHTFTLIDPNNKHGEESIGVYVYNSSDPFWLKSKSFLEVNANGSNSYSENDNGPIGVRIVTKSSHRSYASADGGPMNVPNGWLDTKLDAGSDVRCQIKENAAKNENNLICAIVLH